MPDENTPTPNPTDERLTVREWEERRRAQLQSQDLNKLIDKVVTLEADNRELRKAKPAEGARVLTAEESAEFDALTALGSAKELAKRLEAGESAATELTTTRRKETLRDAAEAAGYKPTVLQRLLGDLEVSVAEAEVDGKPQRVAQVQVDGKAVPLTEYATSTWADFLPSLQATTETPKPAAIPAPTGHGATNTQRTVTAEEIERQKRKTGDYRF